MHSGRSAPTARTSSPCSVARSCGAAQRALEKITGPTRANPDCLELRVFQDRDDPRSFTLLEHWVSLEANMAHGKRDYMAEYMAAKNEIFEDISGDFVQELHPPTPMPTPAA